MPAYPGKRLKRGGACPFPHSRLLLKFGLHECVVQKTGAIDNAVSMSAHELIVPDVEELGPAMRALDERKRAFVIARVHGGKDQRAATLLAGYSDASDEYLRVQGHRLMRNEGVLKAIREESAKLLDGGAYIAINALVDIAAHGEKDADRLKAAENILDRTGFLRSTQHHVTVKDERTEAELVEFIRATATRHGLDPKLLLGREAIEGEFTEVKADGPA